MFIKPSLALFFFLLFITGGCDSKSGGTKPSASAKAQSSTSISPTNAANGQPTLESANISREPATKPSIDACALLEKSEIAAVQGQQVNEAKLTSRDDERFAISQCFYLTAIADRSVSLEVTERNSKNPDQNAVRNFWEDRFEESKRDEDEEEEKEAGKPRKLTGLGDEAYWLGNGKIGALYALKKNRMVRISIGGPGDVETRLAKSKTLAAKVLTRLN